MDAGVDPLKFWDYTISELKDLVESYNRTYLFQQKNLAISQQKQALMIAGYVSLLFQGKDSSRELDIWDFYPELFEDERKQAEQARVNMELETHKARMKAYAEATRGRFSTK